jgi:hypothetical protein
MTEGSLCSEEPIPKVINPLNAELNPICHLLALLGAHHILHVSRIKVNAPGWEQILSRKNKIDRMKQSGSNYASVTIAAWCYADKRSARILKFIA